jgi:hypothetical protein
MTILSLEFASLSFDDATLTVVPASRRADVYALQLQWCVLVEQREKSGIVASVLL